MNPYSEIWQCQDLICNKYKVNNFSESHFKISLKAIQKKKKKVTVQISFLVIINLGSTGYGQRDTCKQVILQLPTCLQV